MRANQKILHFTTSSVYWLSHSPISNNPNVRVFRNESCREKRMPTLNVHLNCSSSIYIQIQIEMKMTRLLLCKCHFKIDKCINELWTVQTV